MIVIVVSRIDVVPGEIVVVASAGDEGGGVIAITSTSGSVVTSIDGAWEYLAPGEISSVSPGTGQHGSTVAISGSGMLGGGSSASSVTLGGVEVDDIVMSNETYIVVVAAASAVEGDGQVTITSNNGDRLTIDAAWEYLALGNIT